MLDTSKVTYTLIVEQDDTPVRGNAIVSGDAAYDRKVEDEIIERLEDGDVWAWAIVTVEARYPGLPLVGQDMLGGCTYRDEGEFTAASGYYEDMKAAALHDLQEQAKAVAAVLCKER